MHSGLAWVYMNKIGLYKVDLCAHTQCWRYFFARGTVNLAHKGFSKCSLLENHDSWKTNN